MQQRQAYTDYLDLLTRCRRIAKKRRNGYGWLTLACFVLWILGSIEAVWLCDPFGTAIIAVALGAIFLLSAFCTDYWTKEHRRLCAELYGAAVMSVLPSEDLCRDRIRMYNASYFKIGDLA
jgi:hypothetical protein